MDRLNRMASRTAECFHSLIWQPTRTRIYPHTDSWWRWILSSNLMRMSSRSLGLLRHANDLACESRWKFHRVRLLDMTRRSEGQSHLWTMQYQCQYLTISLRCLRILAHSHHRSTDLMCLSIDTGPQTCSTWCIEGLGSRRNSHQVGVLYRSRLLFSGHYRNQFRLNCTRDHPSTQKQCSWAAFRSICQAQTRSLALEVVLTLTSPQVQGSHWARQFLLVNLRSSRGLDQWCSKAEEAYRLLFCRDCPPTASSTLL